MDLHDLKSVIVYRQLVSVPVGRIKVSLIPGVIHIEAAVYTALHIGRISLQRGVADKDK